MQKIVLIVKDGYVWVQSTTTLVSVEVRDYDMASYADEDENIATDDEGNEYVSYNAGGFYLEDE